MKKIIATVLTIPLFIYYLLPLLKDCRDLLTKFHFSLFDLELRLMEAIHNDQGLPPVLTRFFHNKASGTALDVFDMYVYFLDPLFLTQVFSFVGVFGILYMIYHAATDKRQKKYIVLLVLLAITPLIEIFTLLGTLPAKILLLAPFYLASLLGIWWFFGEKDHKALRIIIFSILIILSIWWVVVFGEDITNYCAIA